MKKIQREYFPDTKTRLLIFWYFIWASKIFASNS